MGADQFAKIAAVYVQAFGFPCCHSAGFKYPAALGKRN
jgi:hypothetical protein